MAVDHETLLFFDAACLVVAANRSSGGAGFLLQLCQRHFLRAAVSPHVLHEAKVNLRVKFSQTAQQRFEALAAAPPWTVAPIPTDEELASEFNEVNRKDIHVVAAAISVNASYLLTFDRPLIREVLQSGLALQAMTPGDFIKHYLPTHPDYARLRD